MVETGLMLHVVKTTNITVVWYVVLLSNCHAVYTYEWELRKFS